ncbi:MAG: hypothetical protein ACTSWQ_10125 [Candidatus Thorarchaeota archaeon]
MLDTKHSGGEVFLVLEEEGKAEMTIIDFIPDAMQEVIRRALDAERPLFNLTGERNACPDFPGGKRYS